MRPAALQLLLGLLLASCTLGAWGRQLAQASNGQEYFVRVEGLDFVAGCNKFYVAGWNQWEVVEAAAGAPYLSGASIPVNMTGPQLVRTLMDAAKAAGLNTMRTWVHPVNPQYALQTSPGKYNEAVFQGLDYALAEAQKRGIRLILAFTSNWTPVGGIPEYLRWAGLTKPVEFYTNPTVKTMFKNFISTITSRVNTINGRRYSEDPTIFAWDLINEPRCQGCPNGTIAAWVAEMAAFLKQKDPNHLATVGEDGFYGCCKNAANPGVKYTEWAAQEGQNFIADHASPDIDFAAFHTWADNWQEVSQDFVQRWITQHAQDSATILKKPVIHEEWGKWLNASAGATASARNQFYQYAYSLVNQLMQTPGSALKGALFWQFYAPGQEAPASEGGGSGLFGLYPNDPAMQYVRENAALAQRLSVPLSTSCAPAAHKSAPAPSSDCSQTRVRGRAGTGFEGPKCDQDINECVRNTDDCSPNAACINMWGGYQCKCFWGYDGNGQTCNPNQRALDELKNVYWSQEKGLGCDPGVDVPWPSNGPGYVYDPMNSFSFFNTSGDGAYGSRANVTLLECMEACQQQEMCESFVYNDVLESCFLKAAQCPAANSCWQPEVICSSQNDRGGNFSFGCGYWRSYYRLDSDTAAACANYVPAEGVPPPDQANLAPFAQFAQRLNQAMNRFNPAAESAMGTFAGPAAEPTAPQQQQQQQQQQQPNAAAAATPRKPAAPQPEGSSPATVPLLLPSGGVSLGGEVVQLFDPTSVTAASGPLGGS